MEAKENSWVKNKLYLRSKRIPPLPPPEIEKRLSKVKTELKNLFKNGNKTKVKKKLTSFQGKLLGNLQKLDPIVIANSDKKT